MTALTSHFKKQIREEIYKLENENIDVFQVINICNNIAILRKKLEKIEKNQVKL